MQHQRLIWRICLCGAAALVGLSLSPWTLQAGATTPLVLGLPRVLWVGFAVALALLVVTLVGAWVQPTEPVNDEDERR